MSTAARVRLPNVLDRAAFLGELERLSGGEEAVTLGLLDLDRFKALNDSYGHGVGDEVLAALRTRLATFAGDEGGVAGRVGGDEFALALPGLTLEQGFLRLERLRQALEDAAP